MAARGSEALRAFRAHLETGEVLPALEALLADRHAGMPLDKIIRKHRTSFYALREILDYFAAGDKLHRGGMAPSQALLAFREYEKTGKICGVLEGLLADRRAGMGSTKLQRKYRISGNNLPAILDAFGLRKPTRGWTRREGSPAWRGFKAYLETGEVSPALEAMLADRRAGMAISDLVSKHGVGRGNISRICERFGLPVNTDGRGHLAAATKAVRRYRATGEVTGVLADVLRDRRAGMGYKDLRKKYRIRYPDAAEVFRAFGLDKFLGRNGTAPSSAEVLALHATGMGCRALAKKYHVHTSVINGILRQGGHSTAVSPGVESRIVGEARSNPAAKLTALAEKYGIAHQRVRKVLKDHGLFRPRKTWRDLSPQTKCEIFDDHAALPICQIAEKHSIDRHSVKAVLKAVVGEWPLPVERGRRRIREVLMGLLSAGLGNYPHDREGLAMKAWRCGLIRAEQSEAMIDELLASGDLVLQAHDGRLVPNPRKYKRRRIDLQGGLRVAV